MTTGTFTGTPPEFLVLLCPLVYLGVTMCPALNGDAVKMWCYGRLRGLSGRIDSPRLHRLREPPSGGSISLVLELQALTEVSR